MRYSTDHKLRTRAKILSAAGQVFRAEGFGGSGIEGLTKAAGVTNGAFYGHFKTKAQAFQEIVEIGLVALRDAIVTARSTHGEDWVAAFADIYLGERRLCALGEACALPSLTAEVARADAATRQTYGRAYDEVIAEMAAGLEGDEARAMAVLSLLSGATTIARALADPVRAAAVAESAKLAALIIARPGGVLPCGPGSARAAA